MMSKPLIRFVKRSGERRGPAGALELKGAYEFTLDVLGQVCRNERD
jgi:hypothetical protein